MKYFLFFIFFFFFFNQLQETPTQSLSVSMRIVIMSLLFPELRCSDGRRLRREGRRRRSDGCDARTDGERVMLGTCCQLSICYEAAVFEGVRRKAGCLDSPTRRLKICFSHVSDRFLHRGLCGNAETTS